MSAWVICSPEYYRPKHIPRSDTHTCCGWPWFAQADGKHEARKRCPMCLRLYAAHLRAQRDGVTPNATRAARNRGRLETLRREGHA